VYKSSPVSLRRNLNRICAPLRPLANPRLIVLLVLAIVAAGCKKLRHEQHDVVYVAARQTYLHDRVAAVSERVALVTNGQKLEVLDHNRRFLKVQTEKNEVGWVEEHAVIDSKTYDGFAKLATDHKQDPKSSSATLRDDLYMHVVPGRDSDHLYLLPGNTKVDLLARASAPKVAIPVTKPATSKPSTAPKPAEAANAKTNKAKLATPATPAPEPPPPPVMEDWWLARDGQGHVGWLLASRLDVDVPDEVAQYGEGQRFIGCWVLTRINDPESTAPNHQVPEYLTLMAPNKSGMPFDFDQVRVFTWSTKRHRYETGFRLHPIQGFLPVRVTTEQTAKGSVPQFTFQIAGSGDIITDPATGITRPANLRTISYQLIDTSAKRVGPDMGSIPTMHEPGSSPKPTQKASKKKHR